MILPSLFGPWDHNPPNIYFSIDKVCGRHPRNICEISFTLGGKLSELRGSERRIDRQT